MKSFIMTIAGLYLAIHLSGCVDRDLSQSNNYASPVSKIESLIERFEDMDKRGLMGTDQHRLLIVKAKDIVDQNLWADDFELYVAICELIPWLESTSYNSWLRFKLNTRYGFGETYVIITYKSMNTHEYQDIIAVMRFLVDARGDRVTAPDDQVGSQRDAAQYLNIMCLLRDDTLLNFLDREEVILRELFSRDDLKYLGVIAEEYSHIQLLPKEFR